MAIKKFKESDEDEQVRKTALREVRILKVRAACWDHGSSLLSPSPRSLLFLHPPLSALLPNGASSLAPCPHRHRALCCRCVFRVPYRRHPALARSTTSRPLRLSALR